MGGTNYTFRFCVQIQKFQIKSGFFCSVTILSVGARETRLPVGNQISRPVTKSLGTEDSCWCDVSAVCALCDAHSTEMSKIVRNG
jgi:hypothetical protein